MKFACICGLIFFQFITQSSILRAQIPANDDGEYSRRQSVIRVNSSLVSVPVSVTDVSGKIVQGLKIEDFRLTEDGVQAKVSRLADASQSNLNMALLFDLSGSVSPNFEFERRAAIEFLKKVWKPGDAVAIIAFSEKADVVARTDNLQEAMWELRQLQPTEGTTAFFDAVALAVSLLRKTATADTRQAIITITDGADNISDLNIKDALREVQRFDTVLYAINPSGASIRLNRLNARGQENLIALTEATGGSVFIANPSSDIESIFSKIETELRSQYLLNYYSLNAVPDEKFHSIKVFIPNKPELNIRARPGFLAGSR